MEEEAVRYDNPRYREWWAEPDGIRRDRDRYRRAWEVIRANPVPYAGVMLRRVAAMLHYGAGDAPTVALPGIPARPDRVEEVGSSRSHNLARRPSDDLFLLPGRAALPLRPLIAGLQTVLVHSLLPLVALGTVVLVRREWRRAAFLLAIPLYYLVSQSFFILERRVVTPMHYGLFVAAAGGGLLLWDLAATRLRPRTA
jgi:hypothetical protein